LKDPEILPSVEPVGPINEAGRPASFATSLAALGWVSLAGLLFNVVLTRLFSVEQYGQIRLLRTVLDLLAIPAGLGMGACVAKHVADARAGAAERQAMLATAAAIALAASVLVALLAFGALSAPSILRDQTARRAARVLTGVLPVVALYAVGVGYLQGMGYIRRLSLTQAARSSFMLLVGSLLCLTFGFGGWMGMKALTEAFACATAWSAAGRLRSAWRIDRARLRPFLRFGAYGALTSAVVGLLTGLDVLALDRFRGDAAEIGFYGVATLMFATALLLPSAFVQSRFARMAAWGHDPEKTWERYLHDSGWVLLLATPGAIAAYYFAPVIVWVFGEPYGRSVQIFRWLLPAFVIQSTGVVGGNFVVGAGLMRASFLSTFLMAVANAVLNVGLVPTWGVAGAVIATSATYVLGTTLSFLILQRYRSQARIGPAAGP